MSYPLTIACPACGKSYDYSECEDRFRQTELPPLPPEHVDLLAGPSFIEGAEIMSALEIAMMGKLPYTSLLMVFSLILPWRSTEQLFTAMTAAKDKE